MTPEQVEDAVMEYAGILLPMCEKVGVFACENHPDMNISLMALGYVHLQSFAIALGTAYRFGMLENDDAVRGVLAHLEEEVWEKVGRARREREVEKNATKH